MTKSEDIEKAKGATKKAVKKATSNKRVATKEEIAEARTEVKGFFGKIVDKIKGL